MTTRRKLILFYVAWLAVWGCVALVFRACEQRRCCCVVEGHKGCDPADCFVHGESADEETEL